MSARRPLARRDVWFGRSPRRLATSHLTRSKPVPLTLGIPLTAHGIARGDEGSNANAPLAIRFRPVYPPMARISPVYTRGVPGDMMRSISHNDLRICLGVAGMPEQSRRSIATGSPPIRPAGPGECFRSARGRMVVPGDVKKAVDYMRAHVGEKVTVADLVHACGVAERTLRKHFRAFLGLAPLDYLRRMRLGAVREELLSARGSGSVTEIATRNGFSHFGRFSLDYRRCFGESPSSTLRRARSPVEREPEVMKGNSTSGSGEPSPMVRISRGRPPLAILPFRTATIDNKFFAESLVEGLACALCSAHALSVTPARSSSIASPNSQRLAREYEARYCLTGRVMQAGDRLRVVICLLDAANERHLWGDSFDAETSDLFGLQDRVTDGVVRAILPNIRKAEIERAHRKRPDDLGAYDLAMRALPLAFAANPDAAKQALDLLTSAMEIDPDYALAAAMAALCHAQLVTYNGTRLVAEEKMHALRLANRAGVLDTDGDPFVVTARCAVHTMVNDLETGGVLLERALALDPMSAWAWERSGWLNTYLGQSDVAIRHFERAVRLAPARSQNAHRLIGLGSAHFEAGHYDEAARWKRRAVLEQPGVAWVNRTLAVSYARLGDRLAALDALNALRLYCPDVTISQVLNAVPFTRDFLDRVAEGLCDLGLPL
jgi:TolB-like protein/AraC-like DNA-binding protein